MSKELNEGQRIRNKRSGLVRTINSIKGSKVFYTKKNGKTGRCSLVTIKRWTAGKDL